MRETILVISLVVKITQQKHLKGESKLLLAYSSRGYSPSWQEVKAAGVVGSWPRGIQSQKTALMVDAHSVPVLLFIQFGSQTAQWCHPHLQWLLLPQTTQSRHAQRLVSYVILAPIKFTALNSMKTKACLSTEDTKHRLGLSSGYENS